MNVSPNFNNNSPRKILYNGYFSKSNNSIVTVDMKMIDGTGYTLKPIKLQSGFSLIYLSISFLHNHM